MASVRQSTRRDSFLPWLQRQHLPSPRYHRAVGPDTVGPEAHLTCNISYRDGEDMSQLSPSAADELDKVQERECGWYPNAFSEVHKVL